MSFEKEYDFVIIGSGLGGLECAYILSKKGYSVVVLERNHQIGGLLQVFSRDKSVFETGVHYIGGLDEGKNLNQFFKYFGIIPEVGFNRMDEDGFDQIVMPDNKVYKIGQGYDLFKKQMIDYFPDEKEAIETYCNKIQEVITHFPMYNLKKSESYLELAQSGIFNINAHDYIASLTENERLRNVLGGLNLLYAGTREITPFYVHALIINSYLEGAYRVKNGSSKISIYLAKKIREMGGEIHKRKEVVGAHYFENGHIKEVVLDTGEIVKGKNFISNAHPANTIDIFGADRFKKAYRKRIQGLKNTYSTFILHLTLKENSFPYVNHNIYKFNVEDVWDAQYFDETWPRASFIYTSPNHKNPEYASGISCMTYMQTSDLEKWEKTFNTVHKKQDRGTDYKAFKTELENRIIEHVKECYPDIEDHVQHQYSSTPLSFRDYMGTYDGSMYGIEKNANDPLRTILNPQTKVPNLYLTGQNIVLHGVLGVTISAFVTCSEFVDLGELLQEVRQA